MGVVSFRPMCEGFDGRPQDPDTHEEVGTFSVHIRCDTIQTSVFDSTVTTINCSARPRESEGQIPRSQLRRGRKCMQERFTVSNPSTVYEITA